MDYKYDDQFNASSYNLPVAYYKQHTSTVGYPACDEQGHYMVTHTHNHAEFEIVFFTKGSGKMFLGASQREVCFEAGDFLLVNPFELHNGYFFAEHQEIALQCLDFSVSLLEHSQTSVTQKLSNSLLDRSIRCESLFSHRSPGYDTLKMAFLDMYNAVSEGKEDELLFLSGLYRFFSILNTCGKIHHAESSLLRDSDIEFVKTVLDYMEQHYPETIFTKDIAKAMTYSKEHFCRLFKSHFKVPFTTYLTQFRIEKAKMMLLQESSTKVAEQCGFSSQSNFAKAFKDRVGVTPSKYRKFVTGD